MFKNRKYFLFFLFFAGRSRDQLAWLITTRTQVQILFLQPKSME